MTAASPRPFISITAVAALSLMAAGCHLFVDRAEGGASAWWYCDAGGCYRCTAAGCSDLPDPGCYDENDCPPLSCEAETCGGDCLSADDCVEGFVCRRGACLPADGSDEPAGGGTSAPPSSSAPECATASSCESGLCVDGTCAVSDGDVGLGKTCQFDLHCGAERACLDGRCVNRCDGGAAGSCGSGQSCRSGLCAPSADSFCVASADCAAGAVCVNNGCFARCGAGEACASGADLCSAAITVADAELRVCLPDGRAALECKLTTECQGGEICANGVCRTVCSKTEHCASCDDGPVCGAGGYCMTADQSTAECIVAADCASGERCVNGHCGAI